VGKATSTKTSRRVNEISSNSYGWKRDSVQQNMNELKVNGASQLLEKRSGVAEILKTQPMMKKKKSGHG